jgi:hypothetical protein
LKSGVVAFCLAALLIGALWRSATLRGAERPAGSGKVSNPADVPAPSLPPTDRRAEPGVAPAAGQGEVLPVVGGVALSRAMLDRRMRLDGILSGETESRQQAVLVMVEELLKRRIARQVYGISPTKDELEAWLHTLRQDPLTAQRLQSIEGVFGLEHDLFLEEYVQAGVVERDLWKRFLADPLAHQEQARAAAGLLADLTLADGALRKRAPEGSTRSQFNIPVDAGWNEPLPGPRVSPQDLGLDRDLLGRLRAGDVYPNVIDGVDAFYVLKVVRPQSGGPLVEAHKVPKKDYHAWLAGQARTLNVTIQDPTLREGLLGPRDAHWVRDALR